MGWLIKKQNIKQFQERPALPFKQVTDLANSVEGMMSAFSMQVMDSILTFQSGARVVGNVVEFGVFKGRSAAVVSAHVGPGEKFLLVDVEPYITEATLKSLFTKAEFWHGSSEEFSKKYPDYRSLKRTVRFMHVDSSHSYRTTLAEMKLADALLSRDGIVCLDDFTNLNYSQILPALYRYLSTTRTDLRVFLVTDEKCYLCRNANFDRYAGFVLRDILAEMKKRGADPVSIARTDTDKAYRAFYLRKKTYPEESDHYGESIYGHFYKAP